MRFAATMLVRCTLASFTQPPQAGALHSKPPKSSDPFQIDQAASRHRPELKLSPSSVSIACFDSGEYRPTLLFLFTRLFGDTCERRNYES